MRTDEPQRAFWLISGPSELAPQDAQARALDPNCVTELSFSFRTVEEAKSVANFLASFCPDPARQLLGISELLINAVEHGNLELGGASKAKLLESGLLQEELTRRQSDPELGARVVEVSLRRHADHVEICCKDEGGGFDWRRLSSGALKCTKAHSGRGIALARELAFDTVDFFGRGNRVAARALSGVASAPVVTEMSPLGALVGVSPEPPLLRVSESERFYIESEAQRILEQEPENRLLHGQASLAARITEARWACLARVDTEGSLFASICTLPGPRGASETHNEAHFDKSEPMPELWSRALRSETPILVNVPSDLGLFGRFESSIIVPIRHRDSCVGFLHVAENGGDWTSYDAERLAILAAHLAPLLALRLEVDRAEHHARQRQRQHARMIEEQDAARYLVSRLLREGCLAEPCIRHFTSAVDVFNGDVAFATRLPSGGLRWMLGDFVGHGLTAAIGGIPLASIFHATGRKSVTLPEVVWTMNDALRDVLPPGYFCAALLLELENGTLRCWNGGMPPGFVRSAHSPSIRELNSNDLPLGVVPSAQLALNIETLSVGPNDRVLGYSDGVIEASRADGTLFGLERAAQAYASAPVHAAFDHLTQALREFRCATEFADDLSLLEVTVEENAVDRP